MPGSNVVSFGYVALAVYMRDVSGCNQSSWRRLCASKCGRTDELTSYTQVVGHLRDSACKAAHNLSRSYGSAWMRQYVSHKYQSL